MRRHPPYGSLQLILAPPIPFHTLTVELPKKKSGGMRSHFTLAKLQTDLVYLRLWKGYNLSVDDHLPWKPVHLYADQFKVLCRVRHPAYRLELPNTLKDVHRVISVEHLERNPRYASPFRGNP